MAKRSSGKLLFTKWHDVASADNARCYTCVYHDINATTRATQYRSRTHENVVHKVFFCDEHAEQARRKDACPY